MAATTLDKLVLKTLMRGLEGLEPFLMEYLATPPVLADGETVIAQCDAAGALKTAGVVTSVTAQPSIDSASVYAMYAPSGALGADVNLVAAGGAACRQIQVYTGGNLTLVRPDLTSVTLTGLPDGAVLNIRANTISFATTTVQKIMVLW
jgi:hypothetical protein